MGEILAMKPRANKSGTGAKPSKITPMFANYQYSLTGEQQSAIQSWLRCVISEEGQQSPEWKLLHDMTYTENWTPNEPVFEMVGERKIREFLAETKTTGGEE